MPILWRYSIGHFLKISITCILAFIAILLTMRLDEIAHFASLGAPISYIFLFTFYQMPYILPIALPLSCLIASLIFIQKLSGTHELTALRASGLAIRDILAPLLLMAAFLSLFNFWVISELATRSHLNSNLLKSELRSINPLLLLNNKHLMRLKGLYFNALGASRVGESASDVVLALPNRHQERLTLFLAGHLKASPKVFSGQKVTLLTGSASHEEEEFDDLLIENMGKSITHVQDFSQLLQRKVWSINNDYLQLRLLLIRAQEQKKSLQKAKKEGAENTQIKVLRNHLNRIYSEIIKRLSIAIAVFSFTLMGTSFGIKISRHSNHNSLYIVIGLTILYLLAFFIAKGVDQNLAMSSALYLLPHLIIIAASIIVLKRVSKGIE